MVHLGLIGEWDKLTLYSAGGGLDMKRCDTVCVSSLLRQDRRVVRHAHGNPAGKWMRHTVAR